VRQRELQAAHEQQGLAPRWTHDVSRRYHAADPDFIQSVEDAHRIVFLVFVVQSWLLNVVQTFNAFVMRSYQCVQKGSVLKIVVKISDPVALERLEPGSVHGQPLEHDVFRNVEEIGSRHGDVDSTFLFGDQRHGLEALRIHFRQLKDLHDLLEQHDLVVDLHLEVYFLR
jgi:hypothetical protein